MASLRALVKLYGDSHSSCDFYELKHFQNLEEFHFASTVYIIDKEAVAKNLVNLERIHFSYAYFGDIVPFIKHATKLKEIIIDSCDIEKYFAETPELREEINFKPTKNEAFSEGQPLIINLSVLNRERAKLPNAEKITLYVDEKVYLATKRARRETDLKFISLKRRESFDLDVQFNS